ncbi:hypothetical protein F511_10788 [Dorcoceras hygrometricum]|uniref:Uncharacterized protein n=1 Tax=Dorcoceras hygrometricum TaxID=472368 RepID=A0A2Z7CM95_9LAMI|nr:hypothetical protein F511_10788 [Dorcoceras hygrometricum]
MADIMKGNPLARRKSTRLQRCAPASIQIAPAAEWNVAIPLLSPLILSPVSNILTDDGKSCYDRKNEPSAPVMVDENPVVVMKKWQHPAQPFCYEPVQFMPFGCTGMLDR